MMINGKRFAAAVVCLVLSALVLAGCSKKAAGGLTMTPGVLTVGSEISYPPFEYYADDGITPIGFDVEMAKAIAAKLGLTVKFIDTSFEGVFAGVTKGDYDCVISGVTVTDARLAAHNFTKPYIANAQCMVLAKNTQVTAKSPEELAGLDVAYQEETTSDYYMTKLAEGGLDFTPREYASVMSCFDELRLGRVDAIVCDSTVASDFIAKPDAPYEVVWQGPADEVFGICLKKGNDALTQALDKALDELFADGTMLRLSQETFGGLDLVTATRK
jgi:polar amino acid transport system substrate-binding protein